MERIPPAPFSSIVAFGSLLLYAQSHVLFGFPFRNLGTATSNFGKRFQNLGSEYPNWGCASTLGGVHLFRTGILSTWSHNDFQIDWDVIFSRVPALWRLDLSGVQLFSGQVELILKSAAKYCKNVESVALATVDESCKCLKQLTVPVLDERNRFQACKQLFDNVVKFCPGVEYLGGYKKALNEMEKLTCRDGWLVMVEQWEEFNATCTQLREFHWVVAPFADSFFRVFGEHVKPRLKKLTFAENMLWEWGVYFDSLDEAAGIPPPYHNFSQRPEYGFKATDVSSALKGCPALDDLEIELYHPADEDETEYNDPYNAGTVDFPEHEVLNIDIYDDKFCETLVKHCPLLTKFSIWEVAEGHNSNLTPIRAFTDQGLVALAKLKYLTALELRTINCTGNGVFEFLNELSDEFVGHRTFQICVGGHPSDSRLAFYNAVPELLMQLEAISPEELGWGRRKFVLRLRNSNFGSVEPGWSEQYLRGLEHVVNNVKKMHPNLRLRITTSGRRGSTFRSIIDLGLYTSNVEPSLWYGWDDEESDRNITFVNRGGGSSIFDQGRNRLPRTISTITD
ncbi:hypothetical protein PI125_g2416 [Phytophthora idaei]|nr:hypothetical protein PI125_g2416 [Phytophthora idaei]KAG3170370.1 hypothetical protein PI126_g2367 [Phytophthora idaei]